MLKRTGSQHDFRYAEKISLELVINNGEYVEKTGSQQGFRSREKDMLNMAILYDAAISKMIPIYSFCRITPHPLHI